MEKNKNNINNEDLTSELNNQDLSNEKFDNEFELEKSNSINLEEENTENNQLITVRPVKFQEFENLTVNHAIKKNLDIMLDIPMHISVELGRTKSSIREVMELKKGSIVELNKIAGEQVEIYVNQKLVAKGEVIVIEDKFGVRVTSTNIVKQIT